MKTILTVLVTGRAETEVFPEAEFETKPIRSMPKARTLLLMLALVGLAARGETRIYSLDPSFPGNNPEGIAYDKDTRTFFVGAISDGTIYRGTLDEPTVPVFIPGVPGKSANGMKVSRGKLYVAGGFTGTVSVYDIATEQLVASFENFGAVMLNDLVVTGNGDVFITDSFRPMLWHIPAAQAAAGSGTPEGIPVDPEIEWDFNDFNLNGIVAVNGGRSLIVVQSNTGKLFRIDLDEQAPNGREIHEIAIEPNEPLYGDGLLLDRGQLIVVTFAPAFTLTFVKLDDRAESGTVVEQRTDPALRGPSTVARAGKFYLVVNIDFETNTIPYTVVGLPRNDDDDDR